MRAIVIREFGDSSKLEFDNLPLPIPKPGEVRVKVNAIGLNYTDIYQRKGLYPNPLPYVLGYEFSGTVDNIGEGVTGFKTGDRVCTANGIGGYAEYAIAPAAKLIRIPDSISFELAAALILQGMTAHYLATATYPIKQGETVLIHAAAGGVGQLLVQIAKMRGAKIIATVSTEEKARIVAQLGADYVILYSEQDFEQMTKELTNGQGVDVVYDGVGKNTFLKGLNCLKPRGYMVLYGQASGPVEPIDPQMLNRKGSLFLTRPTINHYLLSQEEIRQRSTDLFTWVNTGKLVVRIDQTYSLIDARAAHEYIETRSTKGKVLIIP